MGSKKRDTELHQHKKKKCENFKGGAKIRLGGWNWNLNGVGWVSRRAAKVKGIVGGNPELRKRLKPHLGATRWGEISEKTVSL